MKDAGGRCSSSAPRSVSGSSLGAVAEGHGLRSGGEKPVSMVELAGPDARASSLPATLSCVVAVTGVHCRWLSSTTVAAHVRCTRRVRQR